MRTVQSALTRLGLCTLCGLLACSSAAFAGPHESGVLIPHISTQIEFSYPASYEGQCDLRDGTEAVVSGEVAPDRGVVWYVLACFVNSPGPVRLDSVLFGFRNYDDSKIGFADFGPGEGSSLELTGIGWPGSNSGVAVGFNPVRRDEIVEVYWFAAYAYGVELIPLGVMPDTNEGAFHHVDGEGLVVVDEISEFGELGFGREGYNPLNEDVKTGACCVVDECFVVDRDECERMSGRYRGDFTSCFPNPCEQPTIETNWGRLKRLYDY